MPFFRFKVHENGMLLPCFRFCFLFLLTAVTGGVLRGERARFQLFGDTVNTTVRCYLIASKQRSRRLFSRHVVCFTGPN